MPKFFPDLEQGSDEWENERILRATASNFDRIVTEVKGEYSEKGAKKYARETAIARLLNADTGKRIGHLPQVERGKMMEPAAIEAYECKRKCTTEKMGLVISDDDTRSCSPDRIYTDDRGRLIGVETKCPGGPQHLECLDEGGPGRAYIWQVVGSLLISQFDAWDFWSYHPGLDGVLVRYERAAYASQIDALDKHLTRFEAEVQRYMTVMRENGYEPPVSKMKHRSVEEWEALQRADPGLWAIG